MSCKSQMPRNSAKVSPDSSQRQLETPESWKEDVWVFLFGLAVCDEAEDGRAHIVQVRGQLLFLASGLMHTTVSRQCFGQI